jgi:hypothetical protein
MIWEYLDTQAEGHHSDVKLRVYPYDPEMARWLEARGASVLAGPDPWFRVEARTKGGEVRAQLLEHLLHQGWEPFAASGTELHFRRQRAEP